MSGLSTLQDHLDLWGAVMDRRTELEAARLAPPILRVWDGDMNLRGEWVGWIDIDYEFIENDTGIAVLQSGLQHYLSQWVMNFQGRAKRNVILTIDKQGSRWSGFMDHYSIIKKKNQNKYLEITFKHDYENAKHILVWANPFLRPELQFPKLWIIFGPAKWCCLMTLFVNIFRLETALWSLPDNPLDLLEWFPLSLNTGIWRNIVKPFPLLTDSSPTTIIMARFKPIHDIWKKTLLDAQLTVSCRRYLVDEDPHPFQDLAPQYVGTSIQGIFDDLLTHVPLRNGVLVWDIIDNSDWTALGGTSFGGSLLTGLERAVVNIADDGYTEGVDVYTGDPTSPSEYYDPQFLGTNPAFPWVIYDCASKYNGIIESQFDYFEATTTSFATGGHSMPGVNEAISAGINMGGDFLTSIINTMMAPGGAFGTAIDLPPLGGIMDALAKILYEDVFLAFMVIPTLRAVGETLPIAGLESLSTGLGDFHYWEDWCEGGDKAFTLSAMMAVRAQIWKTRARTKHTIKIADAAPYIFAPPGFGHYWIGNRIGTTADDYPVPDTVFVERVTKGKYGWGKDGSRGWDLTVGMQEPEDPALKALDQIRDINSGLGTMGIL